MESRRGGRDKSADTADVQGAANFSSRVCPALAIGSVILAIVVGVFVATSYARNGNGPQSGSEVADASHNVVQASGSPLPSVDIESNTNTSAAPNATDPLNYRDRELTGSWTLIRTFPHDSRAFT